MANSFGVTNDFIDRELHRFIAAGRLHCKIDKVSGELSIFLFTAPCSINKELLYILLSLNNIALANNVF